MPGNAHKTIIPVYADAILFLLDEKCFLIELGCQKVHFISRKGKLHKMFPRIRLRHMDFLKYSGEFKAFRGVHALKLLEITRDIKKITSSRLWSLPQIYAEIL